MRKKTLGLRWYAHSHNIRSRTQGSCLWNITLPCLSSYFLSQHMWPTLVLLSFQDARLWCTVPLLVCQCETYGKYVLIFAIMEMGLSLRQFNSSTGTGVGECIRWCGGYFRNGDSMAKSRLLWKPRKWPSPSIQGGKISLRRSDLGTTWEIQGKK